jgi:hypothetical protein
MGATLRGHQQISVAHDAMSWSTTPSKGSSASNNAVKACVARPRLGQSTVSADAIQRPLTPSSRTSTEKVSVVRPILLDGPS